MIAASVLAGVMWQLRCPCLEQAWTQLPLGDWSSGTLEQANSVQKYLFAPRSAHSDGRSVSAGRRTTPSSQLTRHRPSTRYQVVVFCTRFRETRSVPVMGNFIGFHVDVKGLEFALLYPRATLIRFRRLADGRPTEGLSEFADERLGQAQEAGFSPTGQFVVTEMHMLTRNGSARTDELYNPQSGLLHQDIFERRNGRWILTITNDRVWKWADGDHFVITERARVYNTHTGRLVSPESGRAYHSLLELAWGSRLVPWLGDIRTGKAIDPDVGFVRPLWRGYEGQVQEPMYIGVSSGTWIWRTERRQDSSQIHSERTRHYRPSDPGAVG